MSQDRVDDDAAIAARAKALGARLRDGDEAAAAALGELFDLFRPRLRRIVEFRMDRRLQGRIDPDDVLQETYLAALPRLQSFDPDGEHPVFVWLRLMVGQTMVDLHRRHLGAGARAADREVPLQGGVGPRASSAWMSLPLAAHLTSPSGVAMRAEARTLLERALDEMDVVDREVIALRHFEELGNREVAAALGLQESTASYRYVRALSRLRQKLRQLDPRRDDGSGGATPAEPRR